VGFYLVFIATFLGGFSQKTYWVYGYLPGIRTLQCRDLRSLLDTNTNNNTNTSDIYGAVILPLGMLMTWQ